MLCRIKTLMGLLLTFQIGRKANQTMANKVRLILKLFYRIFTRVLPSTFEYGEIDLKLDISTQGYIQKIVRANMVLGLLSKITKTVTFRSA